MSSLVQFEVTGWAVEGEMDKRVCEGILPPLLTRTQHDLCNPFFQLSQRYQFHSRGNFQNVYSFNHVPPYFFREILF